MDGVLIELIKHSPAYAVLIIVLWFGFRTYLRQLEISNAHRAKEIEASINAAQKELEILANRHEHATHHERQIAKLSEDQSRLLGSISRSLAEIAQKINIKP